MPRPAPPPRRPADAGSSGARRPPASAPRRPRRSSRRRWLLALLLVPATLALLVVLLGAAYLMASVPLPDEVYASPTVVLDGGGHELGTLQPQQERTDVALADLPPHVPASVLAAEDAGFYSHRGLSLPGLARAVVRNVVAGEVREGGSTISQQYVKTAILRDSERTLERKVREAVLAVKLERSYSKDEILGFYLNTVYFGRGAYGIQAAAQAYYGVDAAALTVPQAAQLAGIIPAPSRLDPAANPEGALARYRYVLDRLVAVGELDAATAAEHAAAPPAPLPRESAAAGGDFPALLTMVEDELEQRLGSGSIYSGLEVTTTLNIGVQRAAEAAYDAGFDPAALEADEAGRRPTGALVALDPGTGGVRAVVGGPDGEQLNLAVDNGRQPGSTFKLFALAAWLEDGRSPESVFDAPATYTMPDARGGDGYEVRNYSGGGAGPTTLTEATWDSINTVYAQVWQQVGSARFIQAARQAGVDAELPADDPSLVLGTADVSPLELAEAYNTFAAGGVHHDPYVVQEIRRDGQVLFTRPVRDERAFSPRTAAHVSQVLRGVIDAGTGTRADIGRPAAGKTGTTQDYRDAWFAGYTPHLTAVVWMGHRDDNKPMAGGYTGGSVPAAVWADFMSRALEGVPPADFPAPEDGLEVVGATPTPTPTPTPAPECPEGQTPRPAPDRTGMLCATEEPTPTPTPTAEPPGAADGESEDPPDEATAAPRDEDGDDGPTASPQPQPEPTAGAGPGDPAPAATPTG